jgi:hypothetical protein
MLGQPLDLDFGVFESTALLVVVLVVNANVQDGTSNWLKAGRCILNPVFARRPSLWVSDLLPVGETLWCYHVLHPCLQARNKTSLACKTYRNPPCVMLCDLTTFYSIGSAWFQCIKLECDELLFNLTFSFNVRRYIKGLMLLVAYATLSVSIFYHTFDDTPSAPLPPSPPGYGQPGVNYG